MRLSLAAVALLTVSTAAQEFGQVGTSGAQLLKINMDPRASAMGFAAASVVDNAAALYTNVAGIEGVANGNVAVSYSPWFADIDLASLVAAWRLEGIGVIAMQAGGFSTEEEITTVDAENGTGEMYSIRHLVFGLAFARHVTDKLAIGIQAKYVHESYYGYSTSGPAFDIGSNYDLGFYGSRLALVLQNFGPDLRPLDGSYNDYSDSDIRKEFSEAPLPVTFRASFSIVPLSGETYRLRLAADIVHPNDNKEHYNVGGELLLYDALALRGGMKFNYDDEMFTMGVGLDGGNLLGQQVRIDYAYEHFSILPSVQKMALSFAF